MDHSFSVIPFFSHYDQMKWCFLVWKRLPCYLSSTLTLVFYVGQGPDPNPNPWEELGVLRPPDDRTQDEYYIKQYGTSCFISPLYRTSCPLSLTNPNKDFSVFSSSSPRQFQLQFDELNSEWSVNPTTWSYFTYENAGSMNSDVLTIGMRTDIFHIHLQMDLLVGLIFMEKDHK